jgi:hypothetical protein
VGDLMPSQPGVRHQIFGNKKGKNQKKFSKDLIKQAEQIYIAYLEKKAEEKEKQNGILPIK